MGVRLYPNESTPADLERLAEVPIGTFQRLQVYEGQRPKVDGIEMAEWYDGLFNDLHLSALNSFITFGWGRPTDDVVDYIRSTGRDLCSGVVTDPVEVRRILSLQGVGIVEGVTSVSWS